MQLFRKLLVRTWGCRIPLDSELWETSEKTHCYIARICHSRIKSENSSNEVARCRQGQTGYYVLIIRQNLGCHIPLHSERYETYVNMYMFINHVLHMSTVVHI